MPVLFVKLTTGEDIIADVTTTETGLKLSNPIQMMMTPQGGIVMAHFAPFIKDKDVEISKTHVLYKAVPDEEIGNAYKQKFGTGIVTAPSGILLK